MPSGKQLDQRRFSQASVAPDPIYALDNYKFRLTHQRLADLFGEEYAREHDENLARFRKEWNHR
jgi:hypothetical protein